jgi:thioredoxin reductase (NADPH)
MSSIKLNAKLHIFLNYGNIYSKGVDFFEVLIFCLALRKIICMVTEKINCLIIGSGPAGYTAAIYASRANLNPVLYEGLQPGGQLTTTTDVENFPGYPNGVSGFQMMEDMKNQALRFGADIRRGDITKVDFSSRPFVLKTNDGKELHAATVIIATGATAKYLGLPSEQTFRGQGVSACATCDGFFYRKQDVAVVGGGDTACEEAVYLAGLCNKVYLIVRRNVLRASKVMQDKVLNTENIEILWEHQTKEILGDESGVTGALLVNNGKEKIIAIHGFFLAIGHHPNSEIFKKHLETDEMGYILTKGKTTATNIPGVFAAGDVQDPHYRQGVTAAASGCMAAKDAEDFLVANR